MRTIGCRFGGFILALLFVFSSSYNSYAQTDEYTQSILKGQNRLRELASANKQKTPEFSSSLNEARSGFHLAMMEYSVLNNAERTISTDDAYRIINLWESVLNWLETTIDSNALIQINKYCYDESMQYMDIEEAKRTPSNKEYYGNSTQKTLWLDQMDIFSEIPYYRTYFAALSGDITQFEKHVQIWMESLNQRSAFYTEFNGDKECFVAGLIELSTALYQNSQPDYAAKLLIQWAILEKDSDNPREDLMEEVQTRAIKFFSDMGDFDSAYLFSSLSKYSTSRGYSFDNIVSQRLTYCYIQREIDIEEALRVAEMTRKQIERGDTGKDGLPVRGVTKSAVYNLLYRLYSKTGDHEKAAEYIKKSVAIDGDYFQLDHYNNLGTSYLSLGDYSSAEKVFLYCVDYIDSHRIYEDSRTTLYANLLLLAEIEDDKNKISDYAEKYFVDVEEKFLRVTAFMTPRTREYYFENISDSKYILETIADAAVRSSNCSGSAYNAALFQKGLLARCNTELRNNILQSNDNELQKAYSDYLNAIAIGDFEKEMQLESYVSYYYSRHPEFNKQPKSYRWEAIKDVLKDNEIAIEFVSHNDLLTQRQYYDAILLKSSVSSPIIIQLCEQDELMHLIQSKDATGYPKIYDSGELSTLSTLIWGKIGNYLTGIKKVYYSPIGELSRLNLDVLIDSRSKKMMEDSYQMVRLSSTLEIPNVQVKKDIDGVILCGGIKHGGNLANNTPDYVIDRGSFGELNKSGWKDLKSTFPEVERIAKHLQKTGHITILTGDNAKEETLKLMTGNSPSLLHLATHGFYLAERDAHKLNYYSNRFDDNSYIPEDERMGLVLSGANQSWTGNVSAGGNDGTLTAREIIGIDMSKTELVVLSACQTGLGEDSHDGTYGFLRAFKNAGVGTIIMSLWKVDDAATQLFMTTFYEFIGKGEERHSAFKKAQNKVKNTKDYKSPRYWAAFVMSD